MQTITIKSSVLGKRILRTLVVSNTNYENRVLRPYQQKIVSDHLGQNQHTLTESPTGSGKSTIMLCHAAKRLKEGMKVIIATPMLGINAGFRRYAQKGFGATAEGETFKLPAGSVVESSSKKATGIKHYLRGPSMSIHVCSYAALVIALEDEAMAPFLTNTVVLIDEAHHSSFGENNLGTLVELCLEKCAETHGFTATAFRTDGGELFNGEFKHFRRTLKEHYRDPYDSVSYCPDFGIYVKFYQEVSEKKFEKFEASQRALGSSKALISAYLDEYDEHPLPTIMLVSTAKQAYKLEIAIDKQFGPKKILNLGSDDGKTLASEDSSRIKKKFQRLNSGEDFDIVIAIKLMNEGIDWPTCAQTFSPRITSSLQLLMQRAIGRAMRLKPEEDYPNHPSPDYSRIVLFEIGIKSEDKDLCTKALFELAVRLKALCEGLDFADPFRFRLNRGESSPTWRDQDREEAKNNTNPQLNMEITTRLYELAAKGASPIELAEEYAKAVAERGGRVDPVAAMEMLIECKIISEDSSEILQDAFDDLSKRNVEKLNNRLTFTEFAAIPGVAEALDKIKVIGAADYAQLLSGRPDLDEVIKLLQEYVISSTEKNKAELLEMARNGEERPNSRTKLGSALCRYTNKNSDCYDPIFDAGIRRLCSEWFEGPLTEKNKAELLKMARNGEPRPSRYTKLGRVLVHYTKKGGCYDSVFAAKIRKLRPDWFVSMRVELQKQELLEMAKDGLPRPLQRTKLGSALSTYITKGGCYDSVFAAEIRKLRPDWFINMRVELQKQELLEMAKKGLPKPHYSTKLGGVLKHYIKKDSVFAAEIRKLRPDWFITPLEVKKQKIKELLEMARKGLPKPHYKSELGSALNSYINKTNGAYDPIFDAEIRELRPDWFANSADENRAELLEMARNGESKPLPSGTPREKRLSKALGHYTGKNNKCPVFDAEIRELRPDWFKKRGDQK